MIKTARQLKDLIRNLSKDKAADAQILMRNYMMERFLERISLSEYRDKFILKGGMLVAAMVGLDARSTMDIDATVKGATVGIEEVENMIASIISVPVDDGVEFRVKRISEIMDEAEYTDPENEAIIQESVARLVRGKTLIVIAHRLSTIVDADQIVVVNDGCIEATGTQAELLQACPLYETLWNAHIASRDSAEGGADRA